MTALTHADRADLVRRHVAACVRAHDAGLSYTLTPGQVERARALGVPVPDSLTVREVADWAMP